MNTFDGSRLIMKILKSLLLALSVVVLAPGISSATTIVEELEPPTSSGNIQGTFLITPSAPVWAFGVGNDAIDDTSISGISYIDGLRASKHWISALISRTSWDSGFDFDSIRPIGATTPSSFSIVTTSTNWQWGSIDYVAFYWLSEANPNGDTCTSPCAVLQAGTEYDAFKFFTSAPASPFAAFHAANGGDITTGETIVAGIPEPETYAMLLAGLGLLGFMTRRRKKKLSS